VWRGNIVAPVTAQIAISQIIDVDEDNVGRSRLAGEGTESTKKEGEGDSHEVKASRLGQMSPIDQEKPSPKGPLTLSRNMRPNESPLFEDGHEREDPV
jgi:hypothetical protein